MKNILIFIAVLGLTIWAGVILYEVFGKIGIAIGVSVEKMHTLFWISVVITILTALNDKK